MSLVETTREEWSPENWRERYKAVRARVTIHRIPARIRLAADLYAFPIGPRWHTEMYEAPIGPTVPAGYAERKRSSIPTSFEDMWIPEILEYMCELRKITLVTLLGPQRHQDIIKVRHETMHVLKNVGRWSLPEIGRRMGGRDHTTILHGYRKIDKAIAEGKMKPTPFNQEIAIHACRKRMWVI